MSKNTILLRIRTQLGTWRLKDIESSDTFANLKQRIETEHHTYLKGNFCNDLKDGSLIYPNDMTIQQSQLNNGDMIFILIDEDKIGGASIHENAHSANKLISKSGEIIAQTYSNVTKSSGFRPGMLPLRSMKKQWTLSEFISLDEQFEYKLKAPEKALCTLASVDKNVMEEFVNYLKFYDFKRMRVGYLYGSFNEKDKTVRADFLYEPPQSTTDTTFEILEDPNEERVNELARLLEVRKVGWIFAHPPREKNFHFSSMEVLRAAEEQLDCAGGLNDTLFVTIKVTLDEEGKTLVDAWQISQQGLAMVAEGALTVSPNPGVAAVNPTFTAYVELKPTPEVDTNFFITRVPIGSFESLFISTFPRSNRPEIVQSAEQIKKQLSRLGKEGWSMKDLIGDFHLLLFLCNFMDMKQDLPRICQSVIDLDQPLDEGYDLLIRSIADI